MAMEIVRAATCARVLTELVARDLGVVVSWDDVTSRLSPVLESGRGTDHRNAVLDALTSVYEELLADAVQLASTEWSQATGLPAAAARTEAGWRRAVGLGARDRLTLDVITALPGTPAVVATHRVVDLLTRDSANVRAELLTRYDTTKRTGGFENTLRRLREQGLRSAEELGWAVIGFESHQHVNLVWHQANKLQRAFPDRSASDLLAYGWIGLRTALAKYDPSLGFAFSTYACTRITGSIRDGVRAENPVPKRLGTFARKVAAAEAELTQALGRAPSLEEVSTHLGTEIERLAVLPRLAPEASVDELLAFAGENGSSPNWIVDDTDPAEEAERAAVSDAVRNALAKLPCEEAEAVRLLIMEELHPTKARELTGATARQMRQRRDRGLETLRDFLDGWDPQISDGA